MCIKIAGFYFLHAQNVSNGNLFGTCYFEFTVLFICILTCNIQAERNFTVILLFTLRSLKYITITSWLFRFTNHQTGAILLK